MRNLVKKKSNVAIFLLLKSLAFQQDVFNRHFHILERGKTISAKSRFWLPSILFIGGTANDHVGGAKGTLMGEAEIVDGSLIMWDKNQWMEMPADAIALNTYHEITLDAWFSPYEGANTGYHMLDAGLFW